MRKLGFLQAEAIARGLNSCHSRCWKKPYMSDSRTMLRFMEFRTVIMV